MNEVAPFIAKSFDADADGFLATNERNQCLQSGNLTLNPHRDFF
ncbi:MAG: hypothetical protein ACJAWS_002633 [Oleiphilaceae bacterium]